MPQPQPPSIFSSTLTSNPHPLSQSQQESPPAEERPQPPPWTPAPSLDLGASLPLQSLRASPKTPPAVAGTKRLLPTSDDVTRAHSQEPASEPLHKRRRLHAFARRSLDHLSFATGAPFPNAEPPSPLFFSSRSLRPHLPARFSSSEAAARMLSKTQGEEGGIKTVTLARGTFSGLSPPGASIASGRSSERTRTSSPDARDPLRLLGSVGIVELLEQDTRPTFIVDIGDAANHLPELSALHILFANSALRASASTWTLVAGKAAGRDLDQSATLASNQFRTWLMSTVIQSDSPNSNPSPVEHGGVIWSCYTLRKRLRVISGAMPTHAAASITPASGPHEFPIPSTSSFGGISGNSILKSSAVQEDEAQDYFGSTSPAAAEQAVSPSSTGARPSRSQPAHLFATDGSGLFQKSSDTTMQAEDSSSFTNECVLRAQSAGDVDSFYRESQSSQERDVGFFDWTRLPLTNSLPRHIQFARSVDWASTPLGPIEFWTNDLRAMCNLIM
jgi:hypothetical protein